MVLHERGAIAAGSGPRNMAVDEALYRSVRVPTLRVYRWDGPCFSLGYFSRFSEAWAHGEATAFDSLAMVRRLTGGGLVEHGDDVTFSLVVPREAMPPELVLDSSRCYQWIHEAVRCAVEDAGVTGLRWVGGPGDGGAAGGRVGVCFHAPVLYDLMLGERKVVGGAQKRSRHGLLHQGSMRIPGLGSDFPGLLAKRLAENVREGDGLTGDAAAMATALEEGRYRDPSWLMRR